LENLLLLQNEKSLLKKWLKKSLQLKDMDTQKHLMDELKFQKKTNNNVVIVENEWKTFHVLHEFQISKNIASLKKSFLFFFFKVIVYKFYYYH
jgi:hypothetical protein